MTNNTFLIFIILVVLLISLVSYFKYNNNSLCNSGDNICKKSHGSKYFCSFWEENPKCMRKYGDGFYITGTDCLCESDNTNENSMKCLNVVILLSIFLLSIILIFCNRENPPIESKLEFMFN